MRKQRNRLLSMLLIVCMMLSMLPAMSLTALAADAEPQDSGAVTAATTVSAWNWVDNEEYLQEYNGGWVLALGGGSEENPISLAEVEAYLPASLTATIKNGEEAATETLSLSWESKDYPRAGGINGSYTFTDTLPEDYALADEAGELKVTVSLGETMTLANREVDIADNYGIALMEAVQKAVSGDTITVIGTANFGSADNLPLTIPEGVTVNWNAHISGESSISSLVEVNGSGTLNIIGGSITKTAGTAIYLNYENNLTVNISGGIISGGTNGIHQFGGNTTIVVDTADATKEVIIKGGEKAINLVGAYFNIDSAMEGQASTINNPSASEDFEIYDSNKISTYKYLKFTRSATAPLVVVGDVTISGIQGNEITAQDVVINLTNATFKALSQDTDVNSWFTNLPAGLIATVKEPVAEGGTTAAITISGTPTAISTAAMAITIPSDSISTETALYASNNANAKYNIPAPAAAVENVVISGTLGNTIIARDVVINLTNAIFKALNQDTGVENWFTNLPTGLTAKVKAAVAEGDTTATITISGTPTTGSTEAMAITIPAVSISSGNDLSVSSNTSAKYNIASTVSAAVSDITISGTRYQAFATSQQVSITLEGEYFNRTAILNNINLDNNFNTWFTNLPEGLRITCQEELVNDSSISFEVSGTPIKSSSAAMAITIPKEYIVGAAEDLTVTSNEDAKFSIFKNNGVYLLVGGTALWANGQSQGEYYRIIDGNSQPQKDGANEENYTIRYSDGTLYLRGAEITAEFSGMVESCNGIYTDGDLDIVLENGNSTISAPDNSYNSSIAAIYVGGTLSISTDKGSNGTLIAEGENAGIRANHFQNNATVTAKATCDGKKSLGISVEDITMNGGTLTAEGAFFGIEGSIIMNGGTLIASSSNGYAQAHTVDSVTVGTNVELEALAGNNISEAISVTADELTSYSYKYIQLTAAPDTSYNVWVGGTQVTNRNMLDVLGTADGNAATVRYTPAANGNSAKLTLYNAAISGAMNTDGHGYGIWAEGDLEIVANGENTVTGESVTGEGKNSYGVYVNGTLTLSGPDKLTVAAGSANGQSYGVYCS
ncbi:MAG: hypothetical protein Q4B48_07050, partial [Syntrophomonadaceae bacterium]|nr:hypothetical protein [Syntrophomonadaceae bacterium]